ncbi:hypothetical protein MC885_017323 [Smutsia gigantea]|nr:hypothetical protein MC885_017323 [Smutsia gigantea]
MVVIALAQVFPSLSILQISVTAQKRSCSSAACITHWLGGLLSRTGSVAHTNLLPTNMGFKVYNRRRKDLQA